MKLWKLLEAARQSLLKNKTRSALTMFGIIIGVAAVIVMMAMGTGAQKNIEERISSMGTNLLMIRNGTNSRGGVSRGAGSSRSLTMEDADAIRREANLVVAVSPTVSVSGQVIGGGKNWYTQAQGVHMDYLYNRSWDLTEGSMFTDAELRARAKVAVLGSTVAENLFPDQSPIGQSIRIRNVPFKVIGTLEKKGQSSFGRDQDDLILIPVTTALFRLVGDRQWVSDIYASARTIEDTEAATEQITEILRRNHKLIDGQEDDFNIRTQTELTEMFTSTTAALTQLLMWIAFVSLIVGGVGVMNIMLVSVTERTREIGVRVSVGARGSDILYQFLIEAIALSFTGGVAGVLLSWGVAHFMETQQGMTMIIETWVVAAALGVSVSIGLIFGLFPAYKAAQLDPIDALRHE
ncbi:ABC transporter permease [Pelagicoccus sp. SDUM812005]|uniref:ABC transporter permease n=1 Tax=Pelagicoccus sp. SDUM812005 TaxID=3041257 RepID=UPI00280CC9BF|nr:ABC transporter permease [Pelagicoccus sp. SDUM812005]MDQ8181277.1 ABC transporter permease [Pelagicoccus sp. SDUM812005]